MDNENDKSVETSEETGHIRRTARTNLVSAQNAGMFYGNHVQLNVMPLEIRITVSYVLGINDEGELVPQSSLMIPMVPELARQLHILLGKGIEKFEKDHGPIRGTNAAKEILSDPAQTP